MGILINCMSMITNTYKKNILILFTIAIKLLTTVHCVSFQNNFNAQKQNGLAKSELKTISSNQSSSEDNKSSTVNKNFIYLDAKKCPEGYLTMENSSNIDITPLKNKKYCYPRESNCKMYDDN